ncbi:MAG: OmpA family protein [Deltaproteobacteria bacterium]|nr:OmpA family protein [Deltaproteobacteria bacterium]
MKKYILLAALAFLFTGCVSTKQYDALQKVSDAKDAEIDRLTLELDTKRRHLEELQKALGDISGEKKATADILADAKNKISELEKENEYLARENERMRVKTGEISAEKEAELSRLKNSYDSLVKELEGEIEKGEVKITQAVDRLSVNLVDQILFNSGETQIKPEGMKVLERVGALLKNISDKQIRVIGHTDNVPVSGKLKEKFPTNWEISAARATNVVKYLQESSGVDPKFLSLAGFAEHRPIDSNDTKEGRLRNRRIEILLLPMDIDKVLEELKK